MNYWGKTNKNMNIFVYKINWRVQCLSVYSPWIKHNLLSAVCLFLNVLSQLLLFYYIIYVGKSLVLKTASIVYGWLWLNNFNSFHHILLWRRKLDNNWTMLQVIETIKLNITIIILPGSAENILTYKQNTCGPTFWDILARLWVAWQSLTLPIIHDGQPKILVI